MKENRVQSHNYTTLYRIDTVFEAEIDMLDFTRIKLTMFARQEKVADKPFTQVITIIDDFIGPDELEVYHIQADFLVSNPPANVIQDLAFQAINNFARRQNVEIGEVTIIKSPKEISDV